MVFIIHSLCHAVLQHVVVDSIVPKGSYFRFSQMYVNLPNTHIIFIITTHQIKSLPIS